MCFNGLGRVWALVGAGLGLGGGFGGFGEWARCVWVNGYVFARVLGRE